ncbi:hypothetical protein EV182_002522, partial [Spiromyces aspiralis]
MSSRYTNKNGSNVTSSSASSRSSAIYQELAAKFDDRIQELRRIQSELQSYISNQGPPSPPASDIDSREADEDGTAGRGKTAMDIFAQMVDDMMMEIVYSCHRETKEAAGVCYMCSKRSAATGNFGAFYYNQSTESSGEYGEKK